MLVMGLLVVGVITTLWLSTQAIADSYRLDQAKKTATELSERAEELQRDVAGLQSASTLADLAAKLGMVPAGDPAHLVVTPDGKVAVVGEPKPVASTPVPSTPSDVPPPPIAPDQAPPEQPGGTG
jgi:NaMN:DMB phosphoribosyltransferase